MDSRRGFVGKIFGGFIAFSKLGKGRLAMAPRQAGKMVIVDIGKPVMINKMRVFVNPPTAHVGSTALQSVIDEVKIVNRTGEDIRVWFPQGAKIFDARSVSDWNAPFLVPKDQDRILRVKLEPEEGDYNYNVYCDAIGDYAQGNSEPHVACP
jgi:hypothetical protein